MLAGRQDDVHDAATLANGAGFGALVQTGAFMT